jgi:hypothetical protein
MASPVVAGTIALMLQANPSLTPNLVKAILQFTAEAHDEYNELTEGAGFLNARGAVELAQSLASASATAGSVKGQVAQNAAHDPTPWSAHLIWGNHRIGGGELRIEASAWRTDVVWGSAHTPEGANVAWGNVCGPDGNGCDSVVWGTACGDAICDDIVWGNNADSANIVWGTACGGDDCDHAVWGIPRKSARSTSHRATNIVWGTSREGENIVWGTAREGENIVWGTARESENIVWGTARESENIVWGTSGSSDSDIVWGTNLLDEPDTILWGATAIRLRSRTLVLDPAGR